MPEEESHALLCEAIILVGQNCKAYIFVVQLFQQVIDSIIWPRLLVPVSSVFPFLDCQAPLDQLLCAMLFRQGSFDTRTSAIADEIPVSIRVMAGHAQLVENPIVGIGQVR
jgi:hypothetical protein